MWRQKTCNVRCYRLECPAARTFAGSTLHSLCMRILSRQSVLDALGRIPRPLNKFEIEPLLYDLPKNFGDKRGRNKRIRAYEAAWARLQHETPGYAQNPDDAAFEDALVAWLTFHEGMLIGEIIPYVYRYLKDNPAARDPETCGEFARSNCPAMASWFWEWRFQVGRLCKNPSALRANRHDAVGRDDCARGRRAANPSHPPFSGPV